MNVIIKKKLVSECGADGDKIFYQIACANIEGRNKWCIEIMTICLITFVYDTEAEAPILWPTEAKSQLIGKDSSAGKD